MGPPSRGSLRPSAGCHTTPATFRALLHWEPRPASLKGLGWHLVFHCCRGPSRRKSGCPCPVGGDTLHRERWAGCTQRLNDTRSEPPRFPRRRARRSDPVAGETPWSPRGACDGGGEPSVGNAVAGLRVRGTSGCGRGASGAGRPGVTKFRSLVDSMLPGGKKGRADRGCLAGALPR